MTEIKITIKCSNADTAVVSIESTASVLSLKQKISECSLAVPAGQQRLIYKGKVLKDELTLDTYQIEDNHTVHMVKSTKVNGASTSTTTATSNSSSAAPSVAPSVSTTSTPVANPVSNPFSSSTPFPPFASNFAAPGSFGGFNPYGGGTPFGMGGLPDMNQMQEQMMRNPEMMQQIMNSPMMESLLNNPEMLRSMLTSDPRMQAMLDANPQMRHILNDPSVLRQSMEMMRNPHALNQMMRSQDLAMSQLENIPGGFNAMRQMFEQVQEPMMEAAQSAQQQQTRASSLSPSSTPQTAPQTTAVPNPWGATNGPQQTAPFGLPMNSFGGMPNPYSMGSGFGAGAGAGDLNQYAAMMQNPYMQQMMQQMLSDPNSLQQMAAMNPQLGVALQNPQVRAMLSNPALMQQLLNPATLQAMSQLQQGGGFGMAPSNPFGAPPTPGGLNFSSLFGPAPSPFGMPPLGSNFRGPTAASVAAVDPATRFATQLQQLQDMGFGDQAANLRAIQATNGNVNAAVERLLNGI